MNDKIMQFCIFEISVTVKLQSLGK